MKFAFIFSNAQEIASAAGRAFISTFKYQQLDESDSDVNSDNLDSDLSDFDSDIFECGEITQEIENLVENNWEVCHPLDQVYEADTSELIKETICLAKEETECAGLKFFNVLTPGEDRNLIATCTEISFWCCCETIKKVSPIIAEATINLIY